MLPVRNREKGSVTIEAVIALSFFIFVIITVLSVINVCLIQARMAFAVNATAREISENCYLYSLIRSGKEKGGSSSGDGVQKEVIKLTDVIQKFGGGSSASMDFGGLNKAWDDLIDGSSGTGGEAAENIASDPAKILFGLVRLARKGKIGLNVSSRIAEPIVRAMIKKHLTMEKGGQAESFLKFMKVIPKAGSYMSGLNFSSSLLFPEGSDAIVINVRYRVKLVPLLPFNAHFDFNQTAITYGWMQGDLDY